MSGLLWLAGSKSNITLSFAAGFDDEQYAYFHQSPSGERGAHCRSRSSASPDGFRKESHESELPPLAKLEGPVLWVTTAGGVVIVAELLGAPSVTVWLDP